MSLRNRIVYLALSTAFATGASAVASEQTLPEQYSAFAVSTGGPMTGPVAGQLDITITRWSPESETDRFLAALKKGGQDQLIDEFGDVKPVGTIRTPGSLAYDLRFAQQEDLGDGLRRIVLATDRPMSFYEVVNRPQSVEYPFTYIELRVNADGNGEGKLAVASALSASRNGKMMQVYNYALQPIQLNEVRRTNR